MAMSGLGRVPTAENPKLSAHKFGKELGFRV